MELDRELQLIWRKIIATKRKQKIKKIYVSRLDDK